MNEPVVYKLILEPEDVDQRVEYFIDHTGEPIVTDFEDAQDAFDCVLSDHDGYELDSFEVISEEDIPESAHPYVLG